MKPRRVIVCSLIEIVTIRRRRSACAAPAPGRPGTYPSRWSPARRESPPARPPRLRFGQEARVDGPHSDPGVVDQHVHAAQDVVDLVDRRKDCGLVADVELDAGGFVPQLSRGEPRSLVAGLVTATRAPASTSACAMARPSRLVAPVTRTRVWLSCPIDAQSPAWQISAAAAGPWAQVMAATLGATGSRRRNPPRAGFGTSSPSMITGAPRRRTVSAPPRTLRPS